MGLEMLIFANPGLPGQEEEESDDELEEEEETASTVTLTLKPVPQGLDVLHAFSEDGEESSGECSVFHTHRAGKAGAEGMGCNRRLVILAWILCYAPCTWNYMQCQSATCSPRRQPQSTSRQGQPEPFGTLGPGMRRHPQALQGACVCLPPRALGACASWSRPLARSPGPPPGCTAHALPSLVRPALLARTLGRAGPRSHGWKGAVGQRRGAGAAGSGHVAPDGSCKGRHAPLTAAIRRPSSAGALGSCPAHPCLHPALSPGSCSRALGRPHTHI